MIDGTTLAIVGAVVAIIGGILSSMAIMCGAVFFLWRVSGNVATSQATVREVVNMVRDLQKEKLPERMAVVEAQLPVGKRPRR